MKKILSLKLNAYLAVLNLLQGAKTTIASLPALQEAIDELAELVTEINLNVKIQGSPSGAADAKRDALQELGDLAYCKLIRVRGFEWLIAPRLYTKTYAGKLAIFYASSPAMISEFQRMESELKALRMRR